MGSQTRSQKIGLSLSGGGSRAVAFHLGCMRALNELGVLGRVQVISTVSGGSVIGALYAAKDQPFSDFEAEVRRFLEAGLVRSGILTALTTPEGLKAVSCFALVGSLSLLAFAGKCIARPMLRLLPVKQHTKCPTNSWNSIPRFASRTTILMRALDTEYFQGIRLRDLPLTRPHLIVNAAELRTGSAFYFSPCESGSWRYGRIKNNDVALARAVMISAAYPIFLPAIDWRAEFVSKDGRIFTERVVLSDGGVYDNLGLAPLWPDRDPAISLNVEQIDAIICCRAGYGLRQEPASQFFVGRLKDSFSTVHERAQNAGLKRLFDLKNSGILNDVVLPFLGQDDSRLREKPDDLVIRDEVEGYPTNFSAMPGQWIEKISKRGEQLTKSVIAEHSPHLVGK
ncbi:MAG: patatin-like phospholipase family protein [Alphaproteobacteria bacterium]|uniref:patatin-like phospholipase family protein n=1 Tax=Roseibium sp. TaxID=1936156 RepID=UPI0032833E58